MGSALPTSACFGSSAGEHWYLPTVNRFIDGKLDKFELSKTNASEEHAERQYVSSVKTIRDSLKSGSPSQLLPPPDYTEKNEEGKVTSLKDSLVALAQRELPSCMGDKYTGTVVSCLPCLDKSNPDFSDESH